MVGSKKSGGLNPASKAFVPGGAQSSNKSKPVNTNNNNGAKAAPKPAAAPVAPAVKPAPQAAAAAPKPAMAWGSKPMDAVRAAPPPSFAAAAAASAKPSKPMKQQQNSKPNKQQNNNNNKWNNSRNSNNNNRNNNQRQPRSDGRNNNSNRNNNNNQNNNNSNWGRTNSFNKSNNNKSPKSLATTTVILDLCQPGDGTTSSQKSVQRISFEDLLRVRLDYLDALEDEWNPPDACQWCSPERQDEIVASHKAPRMTGDVSEQQQRRRSSKKQVETAPPLEECKPLEVNDETRWKAKVMQSDSTEQEDSDESVLKRALLILNKLSLTKFDKLSDDFIDTGIGRNKDCLEGAIGLIVEKAQSEPHFSHMYAKLCFKLAQQEFAFEVKKKKAFKKLLLSRCQEEFELDTSVKIATAIEGVTDPEEMEYKSSIIKKNYLGHMRFIGELYKGDMIKIDIMLWCVFKLLTDKDNNEKDKEENNNDEAPVLEEEKVECFAKLMTTIGSSLENQSIALNNAGKPQAMEKLNDCWQRVELMAGKKSSDSEQAPPQVSNRVKFMLQDLLEMRDKGWVTRRKEETAKTIEQIHQDVAKEERKAARRSSSSGNLRQSLGPRRASSGDVRVLDRRDSKTQIVDQDGFVQITSKNFARSGSTPMLNRSVSDVTSSRSNAFRNSSNNNKAKRSNSIGKLDKNKAVPKAKPAEPEKKKNEEPPPPLKPEKAEYPSPQDCGKKAESVLREYFVGGDTDDAVLSWHEMIGVGQEGSVERGGKVVESSVLLVMEMKDTEVSKMLSVLTRCVKEGKVEKESLVKGLNDPLEFLSDIMVDAPLAGSHLVNIASTLVQMEALSLDFLLSAPEYFRTDGKAAEFAAKVLKKMGGDSPTLEANVKVVEQLMTDDDKKTHASAAALIAA